MDDSSYRFELTPRGRVCVVWAHVRPNGNSPAKEFLTALPKSEMKKFFALIGRLSDHGQITNKEKCRKIHAASEVFELKTTSHRLGVFQDGCDWVATHGWKKGKGDQASREGKRIVDRRKEYLASKEKAQGSGDRKGEQDGQVAT